MSILGSGLLERARSTSLALLGLTAALGLGMVALALNQSLPLLPGSPIPGPSGVAQAKRDKGAVEAPARLLGDSAGPIGRGYPARASSTAEESNDGGSRSNGESADRVDVSISAPAGRSESDSDSTQAPPPETPTPESPTPTLIPTPTQAPAQSAPAEPGTSAPAPSLPATESTRPVAASAPPSEVAPAGPSESPPEVGGAPPETPCKGHGRHRGGKGTGSEVGQPSEPPPAATVPSPSSEAAAESGDSGDDEVTGSSAPAESAGGPGYGYGHYHGHGHH